MESPLFKPGDKVEFISPTSPNAHYFVNGLTNLTIHCILRNSDGSPRYRVLESGSTYMWSVDESELQLIRKKINLHLKQL